MELVTTLCTDKTKQDYHDIDIVNHKKLRTQRCGVCLGLSQLDKSPVHHTQTFGQLQYDTERTCILDTERPRIWGSNSQPFKMNSCRAFETVFFSAQVFYRYCNWELWYSGFKWLDIINSQPVIIQCIYCICLFLYSFTLSIMTRFLSLLVKLWYSIC